jgi:hypothetical protein
MPGTIGRDEKLDPSERSAVEQLVGHSLRENQQLVIQVVTVSASARQPAAAAAALPD